MAARGAPKGSQHRLGKPNKVTKELKEMIREALDGVGGTAYLQHQASENPVAFMNLVGKILPKDISINSTITLQTMSDDELIQKLSEMRAQSQAIDSHVVSH